MLQGLIIVIAGNPHKHYTLLMLYTTGTQPGVSGRMCQHIYQLYVVLCTTAGNFGVSGSLVHYNYLVLHTD